MAFDAAADAALKLELEGLALEREQIKLLQHPSLAAGLKRLRATRDARRQVISDARLLRLCDARARHALETRLYAREFEAGKVALRTQVLASAAALRMHAAKRKSGIDKSRRNEVAMKFVRALEKDGLIRLALPPDVVTQDLAAVRKHTAADAENRERQLANNNGNSNAHNGAANSKNGPGNNDSNNNNNSLPVAFAERVHTSRGTLYSDGVEFEKGQTVAIYTNKAGSLPKYHGEMVAINRKEISIRVSDTSTQKIFVSQLKSGKFTIRRDRDGTSLRNKKL